jgi:CubicO group peptidase (beta-lactamase class C family)
MLLCLLKTPRYSRFYRPRRCSSFGFGTLTAMYASSCFYSLLVLVLSTAFLYTRLFSDMMGWNRTQEPTPEGFGRVLARIEAVIPQVEELRSIGGNAGLSIGVSCKGSTIFEKHLGFRDVASSTPPDSNTVYHIGSMTKGFVAAAVGILVEEGKLSWEKALGEDGTVPIFSKSNTELENKALHEVNMVDLLAHRLVVAMRQSYWHLMETRLLSKKSATAQIVSTLQPAGEFRSRMAYNNWGYALAGEIIEETSGQDLGDFISQHIFMPLGLENSTLGPPEAENYVSSYMLLSDGTPYKVDRPPLDSGKLMAPAGAVKSTIRDMLIIYNSLLEAAKHQSSSQVTSTSASPFRQLGTIFGKHSSIKPGSDYGLGWCITELPNEAGLVGTNSYEADAMPVIGKDTTPQPLIYHNGAMCGAMSVVYLLPQTDFAVVVLANSFDLYDTPDFIGQLIVEAIIDSPDPVNFVPIAKKTVQNALSHHSDMNAQLVRERIPGTEARPLTDYVGHYHSDEGNDFGIDVNIKGNELRVLVQGFEDVYYDVYHYNNNVFAFDCDRDAETKRIIYPNASIMMHKFFFEADSEGKIDRVRWAHDFTYPQGEVFKKTTSTAKI